MSDNPAGATPPLRDPPEWSAACAAVVAGRKQDPAGWSALAGCGALVLQAAGAAPLPDPDGPAGLAVVATGYANPRDAHLIPPPAARARLTLSGYLAPRTTPLVTGLRRAEWAACLAALRLLRALGEDGWSGPAVIAVPLSASWRREEGLGETEQSPPDLWAVQRRQLAQLAMIVPVGVRWEAPDRYFREQELARDLAIRAASAAADAAAWISSATYTLAVFGCTGPEEAEPAGYWRLWTHDGRQRTGQVRFPAGERADTAEYLILGAALHDVLERIAAAGRDPGRFTLHIYVSRPEVSRALSRRYVASPPPGYEQAHQRIARFAHTAVTGLSPVALAALFDLPPLAGGAATTE